MPHEASVFDECFIVVKYIWYYLISMSFYEWFFLEKDRPPAGLFSWSHLLSVTIILGFFVWLGFFLGKKYKENPRAQRLVLILTSVLLISLAVMKISFLLATTDDMGNTLLENMPLFFCDMMIIVVPLASIFKGRIRDICFDFIAICGFIMGFMGNYLAGNVYGSHPAFSYLSLINAISHAVAAFAAMFVFKAHLNKMEKRNIPFVIGLLFVYMSITLVVDYITGKNYMFFLGASDTPFEIFYNLAQGNLIIYQIIIYILQCGYIGVFYLVYYPLAKWFNNKRISK